MRSCQNFGYETLHYIIGNGTSTVSRCVNKWMPKLSRHGLDMLILDSDYTHDYLSNYDCDSIGIQHYEHLPESGFQDYILYSVQKQYSDIELGHVGALKDRKDFETNTLQKMSK